MAKRMLQLDEQSAQGKALPTMPPGTPEWVTPGLVRLTQKVWEPRYGKPLSVEEAITIVLNAGRLFELLKRE